mgnify:CR=1 FL=1
MITWTGDVNGARGEPPCLERLAVNADPTGDAIAARVVSGAFTSTYLIRPGEGAVARQPGLRHPRLPDQRPCPSLPHAR